MRLPFLKKFRPSAETTASTKEGGNEARPEKDNHLNIDQSQQRGRNKNSLQGLNILYQPEPSPSGKLDIQADIIAIHGLGGGSLKTWQHENGTLWLEDKDMLPKELPRCRISSFGYESKPFLSKSTAKIDEFANQLLTGISNRLEDVPYPLVFICHSLGGIVLKRALVNANNNRRNYSRILDQVEILVFLGTPHRGSDIADFFVRVGRITNASTIPPISGLVGVRTDLLKTLRKESGELERINFDFRGLAVGWTILSGYENRNYRYGSTTIVEKKSALLEYPLELAIALRGDHGQICKFENNSNPDYEDIVGHLKRGINGIGRKQKSPRIGVAPQSSVQSLNTADMRYLDSIGSPDFDSATFLDGMFRDSCTWILNDSAFEQWHTGNIQILWLTGDAGAGKSTLVAYLTSELDTKKANSSQSIVSSVFCESLQHGNRTPTEVLKSILVQMALREKLALEALQKKVKPDGRSSKYSFDYVDTTFQYILGLLRQREVFIFLDGLDGLDERDCEKLYNYLSGLKFERSLTQPLGKSLKILISCRPLLSDKLCTRKSDSEYSARRIRLEAKPQGFVESISRSIEQEFKSKAQEWKLNSKELLKLSKALQDHAKGSFLWTKMVLNEIGRSRDLNKKKIRSLIEHLPSNLPQIYDRYLTPLQPPDNGPILRKLLHYLIASRRPLQVDELLDLITIRKGMTAMELDDERPVSPNVLSLLQPLVRVQKNEVEFIHPSVAEYFISIGENRNHALHKTHGVNLAQANEDLAWACIHYIGLDSFDRELKEITGNESIASATESNADVGSIEQADESDESFNLGDVQFFRDPSEVTGQALIRLYGENKAYKYAVEHWSHHAIACTSSKGSVELVEQLLRYRERKNFDNWHLAYSDLSTYEVPILQEFQQSLILAAFLGIEKYVIEVLSKGTVQTETTSIYQALLWATLRGHAQIVHVILIHMDEIGTLLDSEHAYACAAAQAGSVPTMQSLIQSKVFREYDFDMVDKYGRTALQVAAELNHGQIARELLEKTSVNVNNTDKQLKNALHYAAEAGATECVNLLLKKTDIVTSSDNRGRTPLSYAAAWGFISIVKGLCNHRKRYAGIRHDWEKDVGGRTPLSYAMENLQVEAVEILLAAGFSLATADLNGRNPVSWAAGGTKNFKSEVDLAAADRAKLCSMAEKSEPSALDAPDENGWSPLFWAMEAPGYPEVVAALLKSQLVDVNRQDHSGRTVLCWASINRLEEIVQILVADPNIDVNIADKDGRTPLSFAASGGSRKVVTLLVTAGPGLRYRRDNTGRSPLDWAKHEANSDLTELLAI